MDILEKVEELISEAHRLMLKGHDDLAFKKLNDGLALLKKHNGTKENGKEQTAESQEEN